MLYIDFTELVLEMLSHVKILQHGNMTLDNFKNGLTTAACCCWPKCWSFFSSSTWLLLKDQFCMDLYEDHGPWRKFEWQDTNLDPDLSWQSTPRVLLRYNLGFFLCNCGLVVLCLLPVLSHPQWNRAIFITLGTISIHGRTCGTFYRYSR